MRHVKSSLRVTGLISLLTLVFVYRPVVGQDSERPQEAQAHSAIRVTPVLNTCLKSGETVIWCATFQMVWDSIREEYTKGPIVVENGPKWIEVLNSWPIHGPLVNENCFVAGAGMGGDGIIKKITRELEEKFGRDAPDVAIAVQPDEMLAYAYLAKDLPFAVPFANSDLSLNFHVKDSQFSAEAFGYYGYSKSHDAKRMIRQVRIIDYVDEDDFIISLQPKNKDDHIVLAKVRPGDTLKATLESVMNRARNRHVREPMDGGDYLSIPKISFDQEQSFDDLVGKIIQNPEMPARTVMQAWQHILFRLDERGATLRSEALVLGAKSAVNRMMIFDGPFLIYLTESDQPHPYFVAWIGGPDGLVSTKP